jgi:hypothetical protein
MSEFLQAGQHPDADQLNAFVEHTLPVHEQQQTLAHLAVCPACRQIVALSLPPADESPILQPVVRHRWFTRLHPAWAGIPALAALMLVILFVRHGEKGVRQASSPAQIADAVKPAPPPDVSAPPQTAPNAASPAQHIHQKRHVAAATQPAPLTEARQQPATGGASGAMGVVGGIATRPAQPAMPGLTFGASSAIGGSANALVLHRVRSVFSPPSPLPSRLAILSMASKANQRLAIDTDHHLFFSDDEGKNWKAVPAQWKGRAVGVALTSGISSGNEAPALKISSRPASATDAALSGTIKDLSGAVIPGATVIATNTAAAFVRSAVTDNDGQFRIEDLVPGSYRIEAQARGFETQSFAAEVAPAQQAVADLALRPAAATETVSIQASPAPLASADTNVSPKPRAIETPSRFELTTDDGERWTSTDGQSWTRE